MNPESPRKRVLIVDDEKSMRTFILEALKTYPCETVEAKSGKSALGCIRNGDFDLVFLDIRLPDMDGVDVLKEALKIRPKLQVVMMTGFGDSRMSISALKGGAIEYLTKPFDLKYFHRILRRYLLGGMIEVGESTLMMLGGFDVASSEVLEHSKVLVVDAVENLRQLLVEVIGQIGCVVKTAENYESAVELMHRESFNLIMTDTHMPGEDGLDLLRWVKKYSPESEVVLMTLYPRLEIMAEAVHQGVFDVIVRPFPSLEHIADTVSRALKRQALAGDNKRLTDEVKRRNFGLELLYKISGSIGYTMDYEVLVNTIMQSLAHVMPFDVAVSLIVEPAHTLGIYLNGEVPHTNVERSEKQVLEAFKMMSTEPVDMERCRLNLVRLRREPSEDDDKEEDSRSNAGTEQTFFNVPILAENHLIGMINVSSLRGYQFTDADVRLLSTLANQMAQAIGRVRGIITYEKSKMEMMVESMGDGVVMLDERDGIAVLNPSAATIFACGGKKEIPADLFAEKIQSLGLSDAVEKCRGKKLPVSKEITTSHGRTMQCRVAPVKDPRGRVMGIAVVFIDMTARKHWETVLEQQKSELIKANSELDSFVYTASHDLRTPLRHIVSYADLFEADYNGKLDKQAKHYLEEIKHSGLHMDKLISDLLALSRIGRIRNPYEDVDMKELILSAASRLRLGIKEKRVELSVQENMPTVHCDRIKMEEVFVNLVGNAMKFIPKGNPHEPKVHIGWKEDETSFEFFVKDNGIGIEPGYHDQIFKMFQRLHRTEEYEGTGAGLGIIKKIVEDHLGKIWVESAKGEGACFRFTIPKGLSRPKTIGEALS